ncbi:MAG: FkbM family methyltransferase [Dehalococcoidia bacterium]|jgi:FkbM family methyltransferase|nr:FkbM family methyltransferase [Dehalococcoidia bacterium]
MTTDLVETSLSDEQLKIRVHHVGGISDVGPISRLKVFGDDIEWIAYDASVENLSSTTLPGANCKLIPRCIGSTNSPGMFYVMKEESASSLYLCAPSAERYTWVNYQGMPFVRSGKTAIWGELVSVAKEISIQVDTMDQLIEEDLIPPVDVISMDTQGSDWDILVGASKALSSVAGVVCEVMFTELYAGQPLFSDIQAHLRKHDFRFCEFLFLQEYNTAPYPFELQGKGFLTVAEALFLKDGTALLDDVRRPEEIQRAVAQSLKLAAIAAAFDQLDYALGIVRSIQAKYPLSLDTLAANSKMNYVKLLRDLVHVADTIEAESPLLQNDTDRRYGADKGKAPQAGPGARRIKWQVVRYVARQLLKRALGPLGKRSSPAYYGSISRVFCSYGLASTAKAHDKRLVMYLLGMSYPPQKGLRNWIGRSLVQHACS